MPSTRCGTPEIHILGQIVVTFGNLELYLAVSIWQLIAGSHDDSRILGEAITAEMSFDRKMHAFGSLFKLRFPNESEDRGLKRVLGLLDGAQQERNAVLHSAWSYSEEWETWTRVKSSAKAKHGLNHRLYVMSVERLREIHGKISLAGQEFAEFSFERIQSRIRLERQ
jgi:hypothetical protein